MKSIEKSCEKACRKLNGKLIGPRRHLVVNFSSSEQERTLNPSKSFNYSNSSYQKKPSTLQKSDRPSNHHQGTSSSTASGPSSSRGNYATVEPIKPRYIYGSSDDKIKALEKKLDAMKKVNLNISKPTSNDDSKKRYKPY